MYLSACRNAASNAAIDDQVMSQLQSITWKQAAHYVTFTGAYTDFHAGKCELPFACDACGTECQQQDALHGVRQSRFAFSMLAVALSLCTSIFVASMQWADYQTRRSVWARGQRSHSLYAITSYMLDIAGRSNTQACDHQCDCFVRTHWRRSCIPHS